VAHVAPFIHSQPFDTVLWALSGQAVNIQAATSKPGIGVAESCLTINQRHSPETRFSIHNFEIQMNHPAASSGVSQSSFPRRRESRHEELDTRFRGYDKRSKLRGI